MKQARGITASAAFLSELKPALDDIKKVAEELVAEQGKDLDILIQSHEKNLVDGKKEYDEAAVRYFGGETSSLKLKND
ncbi:MAG: hypothetical protein AAB781_00080 [Patescibacteria group bacterium]